jgi:hypothetical protein
MLGFLRGTDFNVVEWYADQTLRAHHAVYVEAIAAARAFPMSTLSYYATRPKLKRPFAVSVLT